MKTLVIGDIHGCFAELQELLEAAGLLEGDAIIALGDIVDRGDIVPECDAPRRIPLPWRSAPLTTRQHAAPKPRLRGRSPAPRLTFVSVPSRGDH
jgi:hypothetical protein